MANFAQKWIDLLNDLESENDDIFKSFILTLSLHNKSYKDTKIPLTIKEKVRYKSLGFYIHEYKVETSSRCHCYDKCNCLSREVKIFYRTYLTFNKDIDNPTSLGLFFEKL